MKHCSKCKETKAAESFGKDKHTKDGLRNYCKACVAAAVRKHRNNGIDTPVRRVFKRDKKQLIKPIKPEFITLIAGQENVLY